MSEQATKSIVPTICIVGVVILAIATFILYTKQVGMQDKLRQLESEVLESTANLQALREDFQELAEALKVKKINGWWYKDTNGDGEYDMAWQDNDGDIWSDEEWEDTDHDGDWDKMKKDTDDDKKDKSDKGKKDTDDDGKFDQEWNDSNGDGKEDAGEWSDIDPEDMDDNESPPTAPEDL